MKTNIFQRQEFSRGDGNFNKVSHNQTNTLKPISTLANKHLINSFSCNNINTSTRKWKKPNKIEGFSLSTNN